MDTLIPNAATLLRKISVEEYGRGIRAEDDRVIEENGCWWRRVRPCFYRPVLPFREYAPGALKSPAAARLGGVQYVVSDASAANSTMSFLMFLQAHDYALDTLKPKRRHEVKATAKKYSMRFLASVEEFKREAHPVYVEFYERTHYGYLTDRVAKPAFDAWADTLFGTHSALVFGAYLGERLMAVNISRVVDDTLVYATLFAANEALSDNVPGFVLHAVREAAAAAGSISQVFVGMPKAGDAQSVDAFYLHRGCSVVTKPALLSLNPVTRTVLRVVAPTVLERLAGAPLAASVTSSGGC